MGKLDFGRLVGLFDGWTNAGTNRLSATLLLIDILQKHNVFV